MIDVVTAIRIVHERDIGSVVWIVIIENVTMPIKRKIDVYCRRIIGRTANIVNKNQIDKHEI